MKTLEKGTPFGNMSWKRSNQMDWMSVKWLYFDIYLSSLFVISTHNIYCNRWQWHVRLYGYVKDFTFFIDLIYLFTLFIFYILIFSFLNMVFLLLSSLLFIYFNYESLDLFGKKESLWLIHFKCISGCCELMKYVSTHTCFLARHYNLVMSASLSLGC